MEFLYNYNALPFYNEEEIAFRQHITYVLSRRLFDLLKQSNRAWSMHQIEAPCLIPRHLTSSQYTNEDVWALEHLDATKEELVLKPETTSSSYVWAQQRLEHSLVAPPFVVWQLSKSFRREQDQPTKHCRFKEFYQQEFQCLFSKDSACDYFSVIAPQMAKIFHEELSCPTRLVVCDRTPSYSQKTWDVEVWNSEKWMEVCSMSLRDDFPLVKSQNKTWELLNFEIATSPDRLWYCKSKSVSSSSVSFENLVV